MKQFLITQDILIQYMGKDHYYEFIDFLKVQNKIPTKVPIWIIGEWSKGD